MGKQERVAYLVATLGPSRCTLPKALGLATAIALVPTALLVTSCDHKRPSQDTPLKRPTRSKGRQDAHVVGAGRAVRVCGHARLEESSPSWSEGQRLSAASAPNGLHVMLPLREGSGVDEVAEAERLGTRGVARQRVSRLPPFLV
jgi:hypothetical protein